MRKSSFVDDFFPALLFWRLYEGSNSIPRDLPAFDRDRFSSDHSIRGSSHYRVDSRNRYRSHGRDSCQCNHNGIQHEHGDCKHGKSRQQRLLRVSRPPHRRSIHGNRRRKWISKIYFNGHHARPEFRTRDQRNAPGREQFADGRCQFRNRRGGDVGCTAQESAWSRRNRRFANPRPRRGTVAKDRARSDGSLRP